MKVHNLGPNVVMAGGFMTKNGTLNISGSGTPKSGTSGTFVALGGAPVNSVYTDKTSGVMFYNEGTAASPYWTPISFSQRNLLGFYTDFRDGAGKAIADTAATATLVGSGIRVHGQGIAETDSGLVVSMAATDGKGAVGTLTTTDEDARLIVLSVGTGTTPIFQPDQNGTCVIDVLQTSVSALTNKAVFCGFCGSAADAIDPLMTYSGTTISFAATQGDDVAGLTYSSELTSATTWMAPHDKGNANASIATTATGVNTGTTVATAGVYQRLRVEVDSNGTVRTFIDKVLTSTHTLALDTDEEIQPMFYVESSTTAVQTAALRHFAAWGVKA